MAPITPISQLSQIIRKKLQETNISREEMESTSTDTKRLTQSDTFSREATKAQLKIKVTAALKALNEEDRLGSQGVKVLVRHILHWSFERHLHHESKIEHVIDRVTASIVNDKSANRHASRLITELCGNK